MSILQLKSIAVSRSISSYAKLDGSGIISSKEFLCLLF
eukprot:CAMPEP_0168315688 /NCGR_PEP_ID=MMETSP0210-20121227/12329_1 /TAXON_ID=40633 /ORGANISM="Condylostoma magnum, Strain COL2" /LENGTH=37 /DNA_ID= /DNA_START= /DNA_END= /DNA_ORIENTATION=